MLVYIKRQEIKFFFTLLVRSVTIYSISVSLCAAAKIAVHISDNSSFLISLSLISSKQRATYSPNAASEDFFAFLGYFLGLFASDSMVLTALCISLSVVSTFRLELAAVGGVVNSVASMVLLDLQALMLSSRNTKLFKYSHLLV